MDIPLIIQLVIYESKTSNDKPSSSSGMLKKINEKILMRLYHRGDAKIALVNCAIINYITNISAGNTSLYLGWLYHTGAMPKWRIFWSEGSIYRSYVSQTWSLPVKLGRVFNPALFFTLLNKMGFSRQSFLGTRLKFLFSFIVMCLLSNNMPVSLNFNPHFIWT